MTRITNTWHDFYQGIKNLRYWFPVVWADRDWDRGFLLKIMSHKVTQMHRAFVRYDRETWRNHSDSHQIRQLLIARVLLERISSGQEWYHHNLLGPVYKKWGEPEMDLRPTPDGMVEWAGLIFPNAHTLEEQEQADAEFSKWSRKIQQHERDDFEFLCDWFKHYLMLWWD